MKKLIISSILLIPFAIHAQEVTRLDFVGRLSNIQTYINGDHSDDNSKFQGEYLVTRLDIDLTHGFSISWRQRYSKEFTSGILNATDWIHFDYSINKWSFSLGKMPTGTGGIENDAAPWDIYAWSLGSIDDCYQFGGKATFNFSDKDNLSLYAGQSFYHNYCKQLYGKDNVFHYSLVWNGTHKRLNTIHSLSFIEYRPGRFLTAIDLGHQIDLHPVSLYFDFCNYSVRDNQPFFNDWRIIFQTDWRISDVVNLQAKYNYTVNNDDIEANYYVAPGTNLHHISGGLEIFPLKNQSLRFHGMVDYGTGKTNMWSENVEDGSSFQFRIGATANVDILDIIKKKKNKDEKPTEVIQTDASL